MRVSFQAAATAIASTAIVIATPASADLHLDELVGHWKLDEETGNTAADSKNGNDGVWQNGDQTNLSWTVGQIGGAAGLVDAGGDNFFRITEIPQLADLDGTGFTISAWIKPAAQSGYNGVFTSRSVNGAADSWGLALEGDGPFHTDNRHGGGGLDSPDTIFADGSWYHVANTWDTFTGVRYAYVNGEPVGDMDDGSTTFIDESGTWFIGYDDCCGGGRDFDGIIDDVAMWKIPLADADIAEIYANGLEGKDATGTPGPVILSGDVNGDLLIDDADFEVIRTAFYETVATREEGDLTGDGFVDFDDFNEWKVAANSATPASGAVPEPVSSALLVCAALGGLLTRRRGDGRV